VVQYFTAKRMRAQPQLLEEVLRELRRPAIMGESNPGLRSIDGSASCMSWRWTAPRHVATASPTENSTGHSPMAWPHRRVVRYAALIGSYHGRQPAR